MHASIVLAVAALSAFAAAVPHAHNQHHAHHLKSHIHKIPPIAGRSTINGVCGGDSGGICDAGYCCSEWGYCGQSAAYCSAGCQSAFGTCDTNDTSPATETVLSATVVTASSASSSLSLVDKQHYSHGPWTPSAASVGSVYSSSAATSVSAAPTSVATTPVVSSPAASSTTTLVTVASASSAAPTTSAVVSSSVLTSTTTTAAATTKSSSAAATSTASSGGSGNTYTLYTGDGTTAAGWPSQSQWVDFESMWSNNLAALISISCTQFGEPNNSDQESADIKSAIQSVASSSGIDPRFILAIMVQESKGCVRTPTTNGGVRNPGLMQSHDGTGTCNDAGSVQNPCPSSEITQMITDGATGTAAGDGLEQCLTESKATDVSEYYKAARIYNSGSIAASGDLGQGVATHCYSSDIANRLTGWTNAATKCNL